MKTPSRKDPIVPLPVNRHGNLIVPPVMTNEEYEAAKAKGHVRIGKPVRTGMDGKLEPY